MTLIKDTATLSGFIPGIDKNSTFETVYQSYVEDAEIQYLQPFTGSELLTALSSETPTGNRATGLNLLQKALAWFTVFEMADLSNVHISGSGFVENTGGDQVQTRQWVHNQTKQKALSKADQILDTALEFMEENPDDFSEFISSSVYTEAVKRVVGSLAEFEKFVGLNHSRRTFLRLQPFILSAEDYVLTPLMGESLVTKLSEANLSGLYPTIKLKAQRLLCHHVMTEAAVSLPLNFTGSGIQVFSSSDGNQSKLTATEKQLELFITQHQTKRDQAFKALSEYLTEKESEISEFTSAQSEQNQNTIAPHDNQGKKSFMI